MRNEIEERASRPVDQQVSDAHELIEHGLTITDIDSGKTSGKMAEDISSCN